MSICLTECCKCVRTTGVSISVMAAPSDYQPGPYSVTFPAGSTTAAVNITINDDDVYKGPDPETFTATITTANTGVSSISPGDDDTATMSIIENEGVQSCNHMITFSVYIQYVVSAAVEHSMLESGLCGEHWYSAISPIIIGATLSKLVGSTCDFYSRLYIIL